MRCWFFHDWRFCRCLADQRPPVVLVKCQRCERFKRTQNLWAVWLPSAKHKELTP